LATQALRGTAKGLRHFGEGPFCVSRNRLPLQVEAAQLILTIFPTDGTPFVSTMKIV